MLLSQFYLPLLKENPSHAELISHQLMLRAGMIRKLASGIYTWLPLGLRVLRKIEAVVRQEMQAIGAQEFLFPAVQPAELWIESDRWEKYGKDLLRFTDRHDRSFCFGPTHEEVVVDALRGELKSHKQLPLTVYQIQTKFRDEIRPRFGVMRGREFLMKDAYSFHLTQESLQQTYDQMHQAYTRILTRLGLRFRAVLADTGAIGGHYSHEFQVLADAGEDWLAYSNQSDYAANVERAEALAPTPVDTPLQALETFETPQAKTIEALQQHHSILPQESIKTLIVKGSRTPLIALILRGDHDLNTIKAEHLEGVLTPLTFASNEEIFAALGVHPGSIGPVNLNIPYWVDRDAAVLKNFTCGANQEGVHYRHANWSRDAACDQVADIRQVVEGDLSPDGQGTLSLTRGIEVGHIFQLGTRYSEAMKLTVLNEDSRASTVLMGCYGLGVSRLVAAAIEQNHDARGIVWPTPIAPFQVILLPLQGHKSYRVREITQLLVEQLEATGIEVLVDDRKERPGAMFATADLIGIPHRLVVSEQGCDQGTVEYKARKSDRIEYWKIEEVLEKLQAQLEA